jgi:hypothetical protein
MNNLRFVRRQLQEPINGNAKHSESVYASMQLYQTVIKLILQERYMDGLIEKWADVPIEDEK